MSFINFKNLFRLMSVLASAAFITTPAAHAQTTLNMSSWVPPTHFLVTDILEPWMANVEQATEGRVKIKILPKPVGSPPQHFELARKGVADIAWGNFTYEPDRFKSLWFAELPFAGANGEAAGAALWRTYEKFLADNSAFAGVKMLGVGMLGGGSIHHSKKSIVEPEDLSNQKIRMGGPIQKRLLEELGAIPIADAAPKAYELIESGVIDGSLHSMESIVNFRLEDKLTYHTIVPDGFYDATFFIVMSGRKWDRLSAADQQAILSVSGEALSRLWGAQFDAQNTAAEKKLRDAGHTFSEPSQALLDKITAVRDGIMQDWYNDAANFGVNNAEDMVEFYRQQYQQFAAQ